MSFYTTLAAHYDRIFPPGPKPAFVAGLFPEGARLLDLGCATGGVALELARRGYSVVGEDLDQGLLARAAPLVARAPAGALSFRQADLRDPPPAGQPFHGALCLGNTLVHLLERRERVQALRAVAARVQPAGALLIQVVNYDRVLAGQVGELPLIDNPHIRFERRYRDLSPAGLRFAATLLVKATGELHQVERTLVPLARPDLEAELGEAGWRPERWWGGYDGAPWSPGSFGCIVLARATP